MKSFILLFMTLSFLGCESNPYPEIGQNGQGGQVESRPREPNNPPQVPIGIIIENQYKFVEGINKKIEIPATVPYPGKPILKLVDMPAGATFDKETSIFSWTPTFFQGNDAKDPTIKTRDYTVGIYVRSTLADVKAEYYEMLLTVEDSPQTFDINGRSADHAYEGEELRYRFTIDNYDYPQGPFSVTAQNLPTGAKVLQVNDTTYEIVYRPDYDHVNLSEPDDCNSWRINCKRYNTKIFAYNPANHLSEKEVTLEIRDTRLDSKLVIPPTIEQGLDSSFQVSSYDLNGDVAPKMYISPNQMDYGKFSYTVDRDDETKSSVINVKWTDIPPTYNGQTVKFRIESCVYDANRKYNNCERDDLKLKIVVKNRKAPVINRSSWPIGQIQYLNHDEVKTFSVSAKDGDNSALNIKKVKILPKEMQEYVSWSRGKLSVQFDKPGIHQFSVVATSEYNLTSAESFVVEVFRQDRSKTLYFTDSTRGDEVEFYREVIQDVTLMNPVLQSLNERNLSGRDTLILGTDILKDPTLKTELGRAMEKIPNVIVASSLVRNMPDKFINQLQQYHNVAIQGRYQELGFPEKIKDLHFVVRDDFDQGVDKIRLRGVSTSESDNPLIFSVGVDRVDCEDILDLTDKKEDRRLKIGIICDRSDRRGRYAILGTEFSDFKTSEDDKDIGKKWLRKMLSTDLDGRGR